MTEEVWSWWQDGSVHRSAWPAAARRGRRRRPDACSPSRAEVLGEIRKAKTEAKRSMRTEVDRAVVVDTPERLDALRLAEADLAEAGRVADLAIDDGAGRRRRRARPARGSSDVVRPARTKPAQVVEHGGHLRERDHSLSCSVYRRVQPGGLWSGWAWCRRPRGGHAWRVASRPRDAVEPVEAGVGHLDADRSIRRRVPGSASADGSSMQLIGSAGLSPGARRGTAIAATGSGAATGDAVAAHGEHLAGWPRAPTPSAQTPARSSSSSHLEPVPGSAEELAVDQPRA